MEERTNRNLGRKKTSEQSTGKFSEKEMDRMK
jgi:hypothetical protein